MPTINQDDHCESGAISVDASINSNMNDETICSKASVIGEIHASDKHSTQNTESPAELWVFGYGSLMWKVDFPVECQQTGYIRGFVRRFYQNSIDHRGTPEKPGRVVTLLPSDDVNAKVFGVAYKISQMQRTSVIKHLDFREKNGYEKCTVEFHPQPYHDGDRVRNIVIYIATKDNESFAGHIDAIDDISQQVYEATGPSGPNREYVFRLAEVMRQIFPDEIDEHLFELEENLRNRIQANAK